MKADSSLLVYIIISVVLFIFSAIGKANKKAANKPPMPNPMDEPVPTGFPKEFEEIFGKIYQEERSKVPEPEIVYEEARSSEMIPSQNYRPEYESLEVIHEEAESLEIQEIEKSQINTSLELVTEEREQRNNISTDFDPRKAIIYAEIINRKYF